MPDCGSTCYLHFMTNPYASFLGEQNPREVIAATAGRLAGLLAKLTPERVTQPPAAGKWSVRDILCHLADTEIAFAFRLRQALADDHHVIQPFDQDRWSRGYGSLDAMTALETFRGLRVWNVRLIESLPPEAFSKIVTHPERGDMTLQTIVETMGGHDLNHERQIEGIAA